DLVDGRELVGGLDVGERVLQLALPWGVRPESVPRRGHPGRVEPDQLGSDLPDGLARPALGLGPVRPAQPMQRGGVVAEVLGHLVELVGVNVEPVWWLPAPFYSVLDDQSYPGRAAR